MVFVLSLWLKAAFSAKSTLGTERLRFESVVTESSKLSEASSFISMSQAMLTSFLKTALFAEELDSLPTVIFPSALSVSKIIPAPAVKSTSAFRLMFPL